MSQHCKYAPSSLHRIQACPGCIHACEGLPEPPPSAIAESGSRIHALVAEVLSANPAAMPSSEAVRECLAAKGVDDTEAELTALAVDFARGIINGREVEEIHVEERLEVPGLLWGTADLVIVEPRQVTVVDWKTGFKEVAEASDNLQGKAYALAAAMRFGRRVAEVHFYNPRLAWASGALFDDMEELFNQITDILEATRSPRAQLHNGAHCTYCPANYWHACPLLSGIAVAEEARAAELGLGDVSRMPEPAELVRQYGILKTLSERFENLKKMLTEQIKASPDGRFAGFTSKALGGGMECINIPATLAMASVEMTEGDALAYCTLSLDRLAAEYGKRGKAAGHFATAKEGKEAFLTNVAGYTRPKPPRVTLVPPAMEEA